MLSDASKVFAFGDMHKEISDLFKQFDSVLIMEREDAESFSALITFDQESLHSNIIDCSLRAGDDFAVRVMTLRGDPVLHIGFKKTIRFNVSYADCMTRVDELGRRCLVFRDYNRVCCIYGSAESVQSNMLQGCEHMLKSVLHWRSGELKLKKAKG
ncbi:hypothetical protein [Pseudomonas hunanensis]|uniref:hypothetical protein n=1 Tax=Pseudomonas hunanensis TaxID=1247546 RepID=UPI0030D6F517